MSSNSETWSKTLEQIDSGDKSFSIDELIANTPSNSIYPMTQWGLISITGEDRYTFLQGQATCDTKRLEQGDALLGAHLNLKGRIEISFIAFDDAKQQRILLLMPLSQMEPFKQLLGKYILFAKADMEPLSDLLPCLIFGQHPVDDTSPTYLNTSVPNLKIVLCSPEAVIELGNSLPFSTHTTAEAILARNGLYLITHQQAGLYLPQELNYDKIDGVSFNKGCYKGQEVVARIHFKGQVKQRLASYLIHKTLDKDLNKASVLDDSGSKVGEIISNYSADNFSMGCVLFKGSQTESKAFSLEQNDGPELQLLALPYAIN